MSSIGDINFKDPVEGVPAFITIIVMPFAYSIAKGIQFGMIAFVLCNIFAKKAKVVPVVTWVLTFVFLADIIFEAVK